MRAFNIWKRCSSRKLNSSATYSFHLKCATPWRVLFMYIILCYVWSWSKRINKKHKWCRKLFFRHFFVGYIFLPKHFYSLFMIVDIFNINCKTLIMNSVYSFLKCHILHFLQNLVLVFYWLHCIILSDHYS